MSVASLDAPAKLTLSLRITGVRDDGFHLIDAEMITLDLADELRIDDSSTGLTVDGPFARNVPRGRSNLVERALRQVGRRAAVHLTKRIPSGGGLGGGSSDAAAVLRWAGMDDPQVAVRLGADVPFCLVGGRARVTGIGEMVRPLGLVTRQLTLIVPPLRVSTAEVYRTWDELGGPHCAGPNDLEHAAVVVEPRLRYWRDRIAELTGVRPMLAGSGATWWVDGTRDGALAELVDEGATVIPARTHTGAHL